MLGGFGICGVPENLIAALVRKGVRGLHTISNNVGIDGFGMGLMLEADMIASHIGSYVGENRLLESRLISGALEVTLVPQGTLAERIRAAARASRHFIRRPAWERCRGRQGSARIQRPGLSCWNAG